MPDLQWSLFSGLTVNAPQVLLKEELSAGSALVHILGRGGGTLLGFPGVLVGVVVSVAPNLIEHRSNHDTWRDTATDVIVDAAGFGVSFVGGTAVGGTVLIGLGSQPEVGVPAAIIADLGSSTVVSVIWDLYVAPEYVRPRVYQYLPSWIQ